MTRPVLLSMRVADLEADSSGEPYGIPSVIRQCECCGADVWRSKSSLELDVALAGVYVCNQCAPDYVADETGHF